MKTIPLAAYEVLTKDALVVADDLRAAVGAGLRVGVHLAATRGAAVDERLADHRYLANRRLLSVRLCATIASTSGLLGWKEETGN